jgi:hypothetical protein
MMAALVSFFLISFFSALFHFKIQKLDEKFSEGIKGFI